MGALELARLQAPDLALLDIQMPGGGGLVALREIRRASPRTAVVMLSADESEALVLECIRAGAVAYLRKGVPPGTIDARLRQALAAFVSSIAS